MASNLFDDLGAVLNPIERQFRNREPSISKTNAAVIKSKIDAAIKSYPEWAKQQRDADPVYLASLQQKASTQSAQTQGSAAPTALPGYAQKRADAAARAQADLARGGKPLTQPAKQPTTKPAQASGTSVDIGALKQRSAQQAQAGQKERDTARQQIATTQAANVAAAQADNALVAAVKAAKAKPEFARDAQDKLTLQRGAAKGIYENKFSHLYTMLETALYEQEVEDPGSFANYITKVLRFDLNTNSQFKPFVTAIDQALVSDKSDEGYANARKILDLIFKTQISGTEKGGISQGISTVGSTISSTGNPQIDRIVNGINSNYYDNEELNALFMTILNHMKRKNPDQYNLIVRDVRGALANFQAQNVKK